MKLVARTLLRSSTRLAIALAVGGALSSSAAAQLLVVSQNNAKVLEYDARDGSFVRAFVEAVEDGFQNPGGVAIHPGDGALYVTSTGSGEIWEYDVATVTTDASANFSALVVDGSQLFVTDSLNGSVVRVPLAGGSIDPVPVWAHRPDPGIVPDRSGLRHPGHGRPRPAALSATEVTAPMAGGRREPAPRFTLRRRARLAPRSRPAWWRSQRESSPFARGVKSSK
jgi:hypothetical protein